MMQNNQIDARLVQFLGEGKKNTATTQQAQDYLTDRNSIFYAVERYTKRLTQKYRLDEVSASRYSETVDLQHYNKMVEWFEGREEYYRDQYAKKLSDELGLRLEAPYYHNLCARFSLSQTRLDQLQQKIFVHTWGRERGFVFEWLVYLALMRRPVDRQKLRILRLQAGQSPIQVHIGDVHPPVFVWFQKEYQEPTLKTDLRPDFSLTKDENPPSRDNLEGIVECKSTNSFSATLLREIWAKQILLGLQYSFLAVDSKVPQHIIESCRLGRIRVLPNVFARDLLQRMDRSQGTEIFDSIRNDVKDARSARDGTDVVQELRERMNEKDVRWQRR